MEEYWVTFRLESNSSYDTRYQSMLDAMIAIRGASWAEPTSFWLVQSSLTIDDFIQRLTAGLNAKTDLVVVRCLAKNASRYFGVLQHPDILKTFLPDIKKSG